MKHERGQAIFLALAAIIFLSLMTYAAFNISQMTHAKTQTLNAADAGAYAMATVVARDLNFIAYTNRAMVANHAVIGQLVSLASLSQMVYLAADDISKLKYLAGIPYIGPILEAIGEAFEELKEIIEDMVLPALREIASAQNMLIKGLFVMQSGVHGVTVADVSGAIDAVVKANDPQLEWSALEGTTGVELAGTAGTAALTAGFLANFTEQRKSSRTKNAYDNSNSSGPDPNYDRMRQVVNLSRDRFTDRHEWPPTPPGSPYIPSYGFLDSDYFFHGGAELSSDNETWVAVDGFELKFWDICWGWSGPYICTKWLRLWMAGDVTANDYTFDDESNNDWRNLSSGGLSSSSRNSFWGSLLGSLFGGRFSDGHSMAYHWDRNRNTGSMKDTYDGIQPYWDLQKIKEGERNEFTFVVMVHKPVQSNSTPNATQTFQTKAGNPFHLSEGRPKVFGLAAAEVYFRRPTTNEHDPSAGRLPNKSYPDGTYASLFSPYWQPRLTAVPVAVAANLQLTGP